MNIWCQAGMLSVLLLPVPTAIEAQSEFADRIALTGKVWGYLKYHHTGTCGSNWDQVLLQSLDAQSESDTDQLYNDLIADLIASAGANQPPVTGLPDIPDAHHIQSSKGWIQDVLLSEQNRASIQAIEDQFRPFPSCHVEAGPVGEPSFLPDDQFSQVPEPDSTQRLLGLFRYWNIVNYFSPYKPLIDDDWEEVLTAYVGRMLDVSDDEAYQLLMREFAAETDDSHSFLFSPVFDEYLGQRYLPVRLEYVEGKTIVTRAMEGVPLQVGDEVLSMDGQAIGQRRAWLADYTAASNPVTLAYKVSRYLERGTQETMEVAFLQDGEVKNATLDLSADNYSFLWSVPGPATQWHDLGQCQLGYINLGLLTPDEVGVAMGSFADTDGIVFDVRHYPQGTLWSLVDILYPGPIDIANFHVPRLDYPGTTELVEARIGQGSQAPYAGRLMILFNENTVSQAEYTVMGLEQHAGAVKIGSQTQAADGNVTLIYLPGGIAVYMTGLGVYYPDGTPTQRIGIVPDLHVMPTISGIREGIDEVLQTALDCNHVLDPEWPPDPVPKSAIYFDPGHDGHGFDVSHAGSSQVVVNYTYRPDGWPIWYLGIGRSEEGIFRLNEGTYASYIYDHDAGSASMHPVESAAFTLDFKAGQQQIACAIENPASREFPASLDWQQEDQLTRWCPQLYRFGPFEQPRHIEGLWYAGEADSGWGITVRMQGQTLFLVLYYYDRSGQPTWSIASGQVSPDWPDDGPAVLDLIETRGYCFTCERQPIETRVIGTIELSLRVADWLGHPDNWVSIEALPGSDEVPWVRDHSPLVMLSGSE